MTENQNRTRVLIVGCGGIGGVLGSHLLKTGVDLTIATTNERVREVWSTTGPFLDGAAIENQLASERLVAKASDSELPFDLVFLAVQPPQMQKVAEDLKSRLRASSLVVCLSNGLCEARLGEILGREKIVGAVVAWGARMPEPGHYTRTSKGGFLVGMLDERKDASLEEVMALLRKVGPAERTHNLAGARFSKLTINCAVSALGTIGGKTLGALLRQKSARNLGIALMREAVTVANAEGIDLEPVINVDIGSLVSRDPKKLLGKAAQHALLMAVGTRYRKLRSSMLAAIERGREPAVDFINGEICQLGKKHGIPTPFNDAACETIWAISRGELKAEESSLTVMKSRATAS